MDDRALLEDRYIAAAMTPKIGGATLKGLLEEHGSIEEVWEAMARPNASLPMRRVSDHWHGGGDQTAAEVRRRTYAVPGRVVVWEDDDYPVALRAVSNPPPVLYVRGDIARLTARALAIVGTTDPLPGFARVAAQIARRCAEYGIHVVSGLARGVDTTALRAAAELEVPCFAVVGHGIDYEYPASSRPVYEVLARTGAVISQFPTGQGPQRWTFPMRNEVMCTLAYGTLIVQAHSRDGSIIQADFSFKHGRDVFVYRDNADLPDNEWFDKLRGRGAHVFSSFEDVLDVVARRHDQFRGLLPPDEPTGPSIAPGLFDGLEIKPAGALLVDIDGVLADTLSTASEAYGLTLRQLGVSIDDGAVSDLGRLTPFQVAKQHGIEWTRFRTAHQAILERLFEQRDLVVPEVREALKAASGLGWKLAAVTSQPRRRAMLTLKQDAQLFEHVITYNDTVGRPKPDPYPLQLALDRLGVSPDRAIAIGDTHVDILAARAARVRSLAVLWGYGSEADLRRYSPDFVASTPAELVELIRTETSVPPR
jgi:DNA protecting protein DprA